MTLQVGRVSTCLILPINVFNVAINVFYEGVSNSNNNGSIPIWRFPVDLNADRVAFAVLVTAACSELMTPLLSWCSL